MLFYLNKNDIIQNSQANKIFISFMKTTAAVFFLSFALWIFQSFFWVIYKTIYKKLFLNYLHIYIFIMIHLHLMRLRDFIIFKERIVYIYIYWTWRNIRRIISSKIEEIIFFFIDCIFKKCETFTNIFFFF
jgi:hypothetical protein